MSGFKSGASSDDPFGSGTETDGEDEEDEPNDSRDEPAAEFDAEPSTSVPETEPESQSATDRESSNGDGATASASGGLPWIYSRDSISDDRPKTVQLHLQESTLDHQRETRRSLESELGESVKKADLREAALLVGMTRTDEIADLLREWGYDFG
ncbi:hypothetical protein [Natronococcus jeotgali]|uniref:Uncharacterized protein n=1 Tax=Natronococcus jeotgali DSM 18795 TaxID=1227498 RepID=L9XGI8_9EURY|nr:hypothetical protein [Natronococcus jeotgali]ELY60849.1 hypothetical protein C492_10125 [Natronococcus jeotgali DSM 18795]